MNVRLLALAALLLAAAGTAPAAPPGASAAVDRQLRAAWEAKHVTPAPRADDARFLRRLYLDLTGTLPPAEKVSAFLEDRDPDKGARVIDELLASDGYARHSADYWDALLMGRLTAEAYIDRGAFRHWLQEQFARNTPWDRFVSQLITAEGYNTDRRPGGARSDPDDIKDRYNPATNWFLRYSKALPELSASTSKIFLGVRIQCAQCHDHKTEKWTQEDFRQFTAFYAKTFPKYFDKALVVGIVRVDTRDWPITAPVNGQYASFFASYLDYVQATPRVLQGKEMHGFGNRRAALAKWMTARDNPWFANAIVNRTWARLLGQGFVEPVDDFRPGNPPVLPETLQTLATDFVEHGYDLRHLLRVICNTEAYQLACRAGGGDGGRAPLWSAYPLKTLDIEVLLDVVFQATEADKFIDRLSKGKLDLLRQSFVRQFVVQMGTDDMAEAADADESIAQALVFLNGALVNGSTRLAPLMTLDEVLTASRDDRERLEQLYLRTLSRRPTAAEVATWLEFLKKPRTVVRTAGPETGLVTGAEALKVNPAIANAEPDADFAELLKHAHTAVDFQALAKRMRNNADAGLYVKAFQAWVAEAPFQALTLQGGGRTPAEQAYEDVFWALLNSSEFLSNH
jgi:hypothetical protein